MEVIIHKTCIVFTIPLFDTYLYYFQVQNLQLLYRFNVNKCYPKWTPIAWKGGPNGIIMSYHGLPPFKKNGVLARINMLKNSKSPPKINPAFIAGSNNEKNKPFCVVNVCHKQF